MATDPTLIATVLPDPIATLRTMNTEIDWLEMRFANALAQGLNLDPEEVIDSAIIAAEVARETVITERLKVTMLQRKMGLTSEQLRHLLECEYCLDTRCMDYATL